MSILPTFISMPNGLQGNNSGPTHVENVLSQSPTCQNQHNDITYCDTLWSFACIPSDAHVKDLSTNQRSRLGTGDKLPLYDQMKGVLALCLFTFLLRTSEGVNNTLLSHHPGYLSGCTSQWLASMVKKNNNKQQQKRICMSCHSSTESLRTARLWSLIFTHTHTHTHTHIHTHTRTRTSMHAHTHAHIHKDEEQKSSRITKQKVFIVL